MFLGYHERAIESPVNRSACEGLKMDDLIAEFLTETSESLQELDTDLVHLEQNPNDKNLLSKIFRLMHTIKGTCGFLGLPRLEGVAHKAEDVLGLFRDGVLEVTPEYVSLILQSIDRIKVIVSGLEENGSEPEGDDTELKNKLMAVYEASQGGASAAPAAPPSFAPVAEPAKEHAPVENDHHSESYKTEPAGEMPMDDHHSDSPQAVHGAAGENGPKDSAIAAQSLRVSVDVIENLMTMVSELVLTRNQLLQILRTNTDSEFGVPLQRLNHVVSDLQEGVMKTRMQPVGNAWAKLPRIVRDISLELGKKIDLEMRGQETELDRQVLEMIKDPLTHMVRNSADHGIESPAARVAAGKAETGKIKLNSYHEGGHIIIEISDDGKGLSTDKIRKKIISNGLATPEEVDNMSPQQIQQFIFKAGFSTAEKVTSVSGRGVGMDVVRTNIEKIGGSIEMKSIEGKGTTFIIKIPLTLAIISALIVESAKERFALPQLAVRELVMTSTDGENRIETIKGTPVFRLRNKLLPLVSLQRLMKISGTKSLPANDESVLDASEFDRKYIVVTELGNYAFGIVVDRVFDTEEIVVKPVARILKGIEIFSGNTILGDGTVIMILDPGGIAKTTGKVDSTDTTEVAEDSALLRSRAREDKTTLLLFRAGDRAPKAVPLELVSRLEEVETQNIEYANGKMVVQYRGQLMPLIPFDPSMKVMEQKRKPVLVFSDDLRSMGLIIDDIIDIAEEKINIQMAGQGALMGSAIIDEAATDVIDVGHFLKQAGGEWFKHQGEGSYQKAAGPNGKNVPQGKKRVLLIEDSPFFRNMLTPLLAVAGYDVTTRSNALEALALCDAGEHFDIIVSDIEMPEMDGFTFAEKVRSDTQWQNTPMVALTSHATPQDIDRGYEAGFSKYIAKFDRELILNTLSQTIAEQHKEAS